MRDLKLLHSIAKTPREELLAVTFLRDQSPRLRLALRSMQYGQRGEHGDLHILLSRCDVSLTFFLAADEGSRRSRVASGAGDFLLRDRHSASDRWRRAVYPGVLPVQRDRYAVERRGSVAGRHVDGVWSRGRPRSLAPYRP